MECKQALTLNMKGEMLTFAFPVSVQLDFGNLDAHLFIFVKCQLHNNYNCVKKLFIFLRRIKFVMNTDTAITHPIVRDLLQNVYSQVLLTRVCHGWCPTYLYI